MVKNMFREKKRAQRAAIESLISIRFDSLQTTVNFTTMVGTTGPLDPNVFPLVTGESSTQSFMFGKSTSYTVSGRFFFFFTPCSSDKPRSTDSYFISYLPSGSGAHSLSLETVYAGTS